MSEITELLGQTLRSITVSPESEEVVFRTTGDISYRMYHSQDCCETVELHDVAGDFADLIGSPILLAEEVSGPHSPPDVDTGYEPESQTWTFYKLGTIKGSVTLRWWGRSNGYYSESVYFDRVTA